MSAVGRYRQRHGMLIRISSHNREIQRTSFRATPMKGLASNRSWSLPPNYWRTPKNLQWSRFPSPQHLAAGRRPRAWTNARNVTSSFTASNRSCNCTIVFKSISNIDARTVRCWPTAVVCGSRQGGTRAFILVDCTRQAYDWHLRKRSCSSVMQPHALCGANQALAAGPGRGTLAAAANAFHNNMLSIKTFMISRT